MSNMCLQLVYLGVIIMNKDAIEYIINCMAASEANSEIQRIQTEHRLKLAEFWGISEGSKVLEIGCGQGDTTAVLAYLVGEKGLIHGIDIASPDYGAPITLEDSIHYLKESALGNQIKVQFETNILSPEVDFPKGYFDFVVLSHSSWYLHSFEELHDILMQLKKWGKTLCFAEWDTRIQTDEQVPHFLSVLIQAQYECFKNTSLSNVRTLFTPMDVKKIAEDAGWNVLKETTIYSPALQDGEWEIQHVLTDYSEELNAVSDMPSKFQNLLLSEIKLLDDAMHNSVIKPMSTFAFIAK